MIHALVRSSAPMILFNYFPATEMLDKYIHTCTSSYKPTVQYVVRVLVPSGTVLPCIHTCTSSYKPTVQYVVRVLVAGGTVLPHRWKSLLEELELRGAVQYFIHMNK